MLILASAKRKNNEKWVEEVDAYYRNDDEREEDFAQDDVDLEEQLGSLDTAEACATIEVENASSEMKSAARSFMDARKEVGGSK